MNPTPIEIRPATERDVKLLSDLWRAMLRETPDPILTPGAALATLQAAYTNITRGWPGVCLLAGQFGTIMAAAVPSDRTTALGYGTYVRPHRRGQGVARALREASFEAMRAIGIRRVIVGSNVGSMSQEYIKTTPGLVPIQYLYRKDL